MTTTSGSSNIAILDSRIYADLCAGKFYVDISPSTYIGSGAQNVTGANVQITNPLGVVIKNYGPNYEIAPLLSGGMDGVVSFDVPKVAGGYQLGKYRIDVQLFDGSLSWVDTKYVSVCAPDPNNKLRLYGTLSALMNASCTDGTLTIIADNVPNYNGKVVESQVNDLTVEYPTSSGLDPLDTALGSFSVQLYEGVYKLTGNICATYNFGDNVYVKVKYTVKKEKNVRCLLDECCVLTKLADLHKLLASDCTTQEREAHTEIVLDALRLLKTAKLAAQCGSDPSEYIVALEELLGCECTCNCAEGTPIVNTAPSKDFVIEGCNVTKETVGLTDHYTIENYDYLIEVADNGGVVTVSVSTLNGCVKKQIITFSIAAAYSQIKTLANQNNTEADIWASIVNKSLRDINPSCLGISQTSWNNYTLNQKITALMTQMCNCCGCDGAVSNIDTTQSGADVILSFDVNNATVYAKVYVDDLFIQELFTASSKTGLSVTLPGYADGLQHTYTIIPYCANSSAGTMASDEFIYIGCPSISPPVVSSNNINGVTCPYDLTAIVTPPPAGITTEWHTANNTSAATLVADPTNVTSGVYYAFSKDSNGCYSTSTQVTLICGSEASCSAPQNLVVNVPLAHGPASITFQSAAFPPPGNSYTVKRKAAGDPDTDGSYTTIGTPVYNSSISRWQIFDSTYTENTLYTYKAISNCAGSPVTSPAAYYTFAAIVCAAVSTTPHSDSVDYSLVTTGSNEIDSYVVALYDATGTILLQSATYTPAFANPITGSFTYLTASTTYKIKVTACIGSFCKTSCSTVSFTTTGSTSQNFTVNSSNGMTVTGVTGTGVPAGLVFPVASGNHTSDHQTGLPNTPIAIDLTGTPGTTCKLTLYVDGNPNDCVAVPGAGTYGLTPLAPVVEGQAVIISVEIGTC